MKSGCILLAKMVTARAYCLLIAHSLGCKREACPWLRRGNIGGTDCLGAGFGVTGAERDGEERLPKTSSPDQLRSSTPRIHTLRKSHMRPPATKFTGHNNRKVKLASPTVRRIPRGTVRRIRRGRPGSRLFRTPEWVREDRPDVTPAAIGSRVRTRTHTVCGLRHARSGSKQQDRRLSHLLT